MKNLNERKVGAGTSVENLILFTIAIVIVWVVAALVMGKFNDVNISNGLQETVREGTSVAPMTDTVEADLISLLSRITGEPIILAHGSNNTLVMDKFDHSGKTFTYTTGGGALSDEGIYNSTLIALRASNLVESIKTDGFDTDDSMPSMTITLK